MGIDSSGYIWLDGQIVPHVQALIPLDSPAVLSGAVIVESIACSTNIPHETALSTVVGVDTSSTVEQPARGNSVTQQSGARESATQQPGERRFLFRVRDHFERFERSCRIAGIALPFDIDRLCVAAAEVVRMCSDMPACVQAVAYCGIPETHATKESLGVPNSTVHVALLPMKQSVRYSASDGVVDNTAIAGQTHSGGNKTSSSDDAFVLNVPESSGVHAEISSWRQLSPNALPVALQSIAARFHAELVLDQVRRSGFNEAILLDEAGRVSSVARGNLFIVRDHYLSTPPASDGAPEGITRDTVLCLAEDLHHEFDLHILEESMTRVDLYAADQAFACSTTRGIRPIVSIDHRSLRGGPSTRGIVEALQERYRACLAGEIEEYRDWLYEV